MSTIVKKNTYFNKKKTWTHQNEKPVGKSNISKTYFSEHFQKRRDIYGVWKELFSKNPVELRSIRAIKV